jgi:hypothetical protein
MLEQPVWSRLANAENILIAGCGGGYDVLGAVPLMVRLLDADKRVHLASLTFSNADRLELDEFDPNLPNLKGISGRAAREDRYCPEAWLARWKEDRLGLKEPVWLFDRTGVPPLVAAYGRLAKSLRLDAIILVDGGIDALLRGDEFRLGTPMEDYASLAAASSLEDVPVKILACLGMGAEWRDGIRHRQVFDRIADLNQRGAYWGVCALMPGTREGDLYLEALDFVLEGQSRQRNSYVHACVRRAMGRGELPEPVWQWSLLNMYWFFDLMAAARANIHLENIRGAWEDLEVSAIIDRVHASLNREDPGPIPL